MTPECETAGIRDLWQSVLLRGFIDATYEGNSHEHKMARISADRWIRLCGADFRRVCDMAGMDAEFLSDAYKAGRVDRRLLKNLDNSNEELLAEVKAALKTVLVGEMTAEQITERLSKDLGREVKLRSIRRVLRNEHVAGRVSRKATVGRSAIWTMCSEQHVPLCDRLAMAKKEATQRHQPPQAPCTAQQGVNATSGPEIER